MAIEIDYERGRLAAELLYKAFSTTGIHGRRVMPEDDLPREIRKGSLEHILFITLTVEATNMRSNLVAFPLTL